MRKNRLWCFRSLFSMVMKRGFEKGEGNVQGCSSPGAFVRIFVAQCIIVGEGRGGMLRYVEMT